MEVYFSLGSNLGDRGKNIKTALSLMDREFGKQYSALSSILETEPWGFDSDDLFLNCAVMYDLDIPCDEILAVCKKVEMLMGRSVLILTYCSTGNIG